jgi:hypothetical protein
MRGTATIVNGSANDPVENRHRLEIEPAIPPTAPGTSGQMSSVGSRDLPAKVAPQPVRAV